MEGREIATTLVLLGRTGNGKSATGNSILGRKAFRSQTSSSAITATCELQQVQRKDGRKLNVIDTPGLFDPTTKQDILLKEIVKCIDLAKDGFHGVLLVLSTKNRFSTEEATTLEILQKLFGEKILNYMVVIFTGGDELEENEQTFEDYLRTSSPALKESLSRKKMEQMVKAHVEQIKQLQEQMAKAYAKQNLIEIKQLKEEKEKAHAEQKARMEKAHAEEMKKLTDKVQEKMTEINNRSWWERNCVIM